MKIFHIQAKSDADIMPCVRKALKLLKKDKKEVALVTTIQHLHKIKEAEVFLEQNGIKAKVMGQVLGCSVPKIPADVEQVLYIGSGRFHPTGVLMRSKKEVIAANPFTGDARKITSKDLQDIEKRKKAGTIRFMSSDVIGIIMSTKPGQTGVQGGMKRIDELKKRYPKKEYYTFAFDTIQENQLEDFPFIQCWVNTACPRIMEDFSRGMVNLEDLQ